MRPRRLELDGFSTFRERTVLDFDGLDLVAFTGATGAGKSTLIDAITFALYGSVARYDNTARVAPVIHQLSNQARVRMDFEAGGRTYTATRVVRRRTSKAGDNASASTTEARLEVDAGGGETTVLAGDVKELNAAVEELLGLDFKQFTRTIVLPQGEFASFLRDDPANRDKLLQRLLDMGVYETMGRLARAQAKKSANQVEALADQRVRNPPLSDEAFEDLATRVGEVERIASLVADGVIELAALDEQLDPLRSRVTEIDRAMERLEAIEVPTDLPGLDAEQRKATDRRTELQASLAKAKEIRDHALSYLDGKPDKGEVVRALSQVEQLAEANEKRQDLQAGAADVAVQVVDLTKAQQDAEETLAVAEASLRTARLASDAAGWTAALAVGEPCPVCHRDVETIPDHDAAREVEAFEAEYATLSSQAKTVAKNLAKATGIASASAEEIERQGERIDLLELQLSAYAGDPEPGELQRLLESVDEAERQYRITLDEVGRIESEVEQATEAERSLQTTVRSMQAELASHRDSLSDLGPPPLGHTSLIDDYDTIRRWAKDTASELGTQRADLAKNGKILANQRAALASTLADAAATVGISTEPDQMTAGLSEALSEAKANAAAARQRRQDDGELATQIEALEQDRTLNDALGRHLRAGGFGSWLLAEALDNIVAKATGWLLGLSNNQYSLVTGDKNFAIIDHNNADETRDVRTLSGGETFLASLALALALADSIAELAPVDSPRLESMFLDEGFGTLDPGTLDVVAGAIEELASTGRMIGIVTHVGELAERMPARFEVTKSGSGSSVELVQV